MIRRTIRATKNNVSILTTAVILILSAGNANAFTIGFSFADVAKSFSAVAHSSASGRSAGSSAVRRGLTTWSHYPRRALARRDGVAGLIAADSANFTGRWVRHRGQQASSSASSTSSAVGLPMMGLPMMHGNIEVAFLGIDRLADFRHLRERLLRSFLFGWRFNRWFAHHELEPPAAIPLPAALLVLSSALFSLMAFARRSPLR